MSTLTANKTFKNVTELLDAALSLRYFHPEPDGSVAIPVVRDHGSCPLVMVTGENACGKSFFRRVVKGTCSTNKIECMDLSMEGRSGEYGGLRSFIYGDEERESTGVNSVYGVLTGIKTCMQRDNPHVIFWDEPSLGLSDGWSAGLGKKLAEFAKNPGANTLGIFVVTHCKAMAREIAPVVPHYLHLGDLEGPKNLVKWIEAISPVRDIEKLAETSRARWKLIQAIRKESSKR